VTHRWILAVLLAPTAAACENKWSAHVGDAVLAQCQNAGPARPGPTVVITSAEDAAHLTWPQGPVVRLAFDRTVPWQTVDTVMKQVRQAGKQPELLVGARSDVRGFVLEDPTDGGPALQLAADGTSKFCLRHPDLEEAYCVRGADPRQIVRGFVREATHEAIKAYSIHQVAVVLEPDIHWENVVRVIDGARTCCAGVDVRVHLGQKAPPATVQLGAP
jgi:hypothetical protein